MDLPIIDQFDRRLGIVDWKLMERVQQRWWLYSLVLVISWIDNSIWTRIGVSKYFAYFTKFFNQTYFATDNQADFIKSPEYVLANTLESAVLGVNISLIH